MAQYIRDHKEELQQRAAAIRTAARARLAQANTATPITNKDWIRWIEDNAVLWQTLLSKSTRERQERFSKRLLPIENLLEAARIKPVEARLSQWVRAMRASKSGFTLA